MVSCRVDQILRDANGCQVEAREKNTLKVTLKLVDEGGARIPLSALDTLTLSIYARDLPNQPEIAGTVAAPRNIKNANGGTITDGPTDTILQLVLNPTDNIIVDSTKAADATYQEWHVLLLNGTYSGSKEFHQEIHYPVWNLTKVASP